jgi:hypothetical protein
MTAMMRAREEASMVGGMSQEAASRYNGVGGDSGNPGAGGAGGTAGEGAGGGKGGGEGGMGDRECVSPGTVFIVKVQLCAPGATNVTILVYDEGKVSFSGKDTTGGTQGGIQDIYSYVI